MLSPGQIAPPIRHVVRRYKNVRVELAEVTGFDLDRRVVHATTRRHLDGLELPYDSLIVAAGVNQSYFGHDELARYAPRHEDDRRRPRAAPADLRRLRDGRGGPTDPVEQEKWLTIVIVGAGPTGVELAGQVRELAVRCLRGEFRTFDPASVRVVLLDGGKEPLPRSATDSRARPPRSSSASASSCGWAPGWSASTPFGVDVAGADGGGSRIEAQTTIWAAGVQASPLAAEAGRGQWGRA